MITEIAERIRQGALRKPRFLVGISGPPASGKSALSRGLQAFLGNDSVVVPMDGFHLDNAVLRESGLLARKGAPETFDLEGFAALLERIRGASGTVYFPIFYRQADLSRAAAGAVTPQHPIVLVEGNYLLLQRPGWSDLRPYFDLTIFLNVDEAEVKQRSLGRWASHGKSREEALKKVEENDLPNARLVIEHSSAADISL